MKKVVSILFLGLIIAVGLFAQVTDAQIRQAATTLGVPYEALKQFVESYKLQSTSSGTISIDSVKLYQEYETNEIRADSQYSGIPMKKGFPIETGRLEME